MIVIIPFSPRGVNFILLNTGRTLYTTDGFLSYFFLNMHVYLSVNVQKSADALSQEL